MLGLYQGLAFSEFGFDVTCIDKDVAKIETINQGVMPIHEPGLADFGGAKYARWPSAFQQQFKLGSGAC